MLLELAPHPSSRAPFALGVAAAVEALVGGGVCFRYRVRGDLARVRVPPHNTARRADELWRHTCFEAFVQARGAERYVELNFSPSGAWAAYAFERYRQRAEPLPAVAPPAVRYSVDGGELRLDAALPSMPLGAAAAVGLTAVIEDVDGMQSFWALAHPRAMPDFHDAAGWTASLASMLIASPA